MSLILVAHRLSTIMNADNIIVIEDACVIEQGNHDSLMKIKGKYFSLIEDQLDSIK